MNCEECKEQVFELIEREAVDPEGVREILARCPDCRVAFDEMKAALALAERLPVEEPPAALDAAILRAAAARAPKVVPVRKRRLQAPPWAMAAIAMLAIGVGVWAIPREVQLEGDGAPNDLDSAREVIVAEEMPGPEAEVADEIVEAEAASEPTVAGRSEERMAAKSTAAPARRPRAKRRSGSPADEPKAVSLDEALPSQPASNAAAGAAAKSRAAEAGSEALRSRKQEKEEDEATATCRRKVDEIERRTHDDKDDVPKPEEELAIGKCYQRLGRVDDARKWLQRAATHPQTKARAQEALRQLAGD